MPLNGHRQPALTREMIARAFPALPPDDPHAVRTLTPEELDAGFERFWAGAGAPSEIHLFAYGSLMWKPEAGFGEGRIASIGGWHRRFCLWMWRWRGSRANPGLMLALSPGGACRGMLFRLGGPGLEETMRAVWHREMIGNGYRCRPVVARTGEGDTPAFTFIANRDSDRFAGTLPLEEIARYMARACGNGGANAEYLLETVITCETLGIRDAMLWELQRLVAAHMSQGEGRTP
jgi:cation transport protein ChaC